ncbi:MAG: hypothetical protein ACD_3C00064G0002 [uncultured bacterium (gcode 4)]|uniref:Uncharacterized protein n=1 Tax=uncultured bacterium (gcode 4) TaxID=1234023 RepID=K2FZK2_9BACT|nr:MAG: hypothetical protein ACD_3C00064G0002 [uncultured bacterium (gcode 4)]
MVAAQLLYCIQAVVQVLTYVFHISPRLVQLMLEDKSLLITAIKETVLQLIVISTFHAVIIEDISWIGVYTTPPQATLHVISSIIPNISHFSNGYLFVYENAEVTGMPSFSDNISLSDKAKSWSKDNHLLIKGLKFRATDDGFSKNHRSWYLFWE